MLIEVFVAVVLVTLPFGFYRAHTRKLPLRWWIRRHATAPPSEASVGPPGTKLN